MAALTESQARERDLIAKALARLGWRVQRAISVSLPHCDDCDPADAIELLIERHLSPPFIAEHRLAIRGVTEETAEWMARAIVSASCRAYDEHTRRERSVHITLSVN